MHDNPIHLLMMSLAQIDYQSPFRSPSITQVNPYVGQQPSPYIAQSEYQSPFTYQIEGQQPVQQPTLILHNQPYIVTTDHYCSTGEINNVSVQSLSLTRSPYIYWFQIENIKYEEPLDPEFTMYLSKLYQVQGDGWDTYGNAQHVKH